MWAFSSAKHPAPELFDAIAAEVMPRVAQFNAQELANTAWAFATAGHEQPELFDAIAAAATPNVADFNAMELASLAWGFATAGHPAAELYERIALAAAPKLEQFDTQGLSSLAWAFATARATSSAGESTKASSPATSALFDAIAAAAIPQLGDFAAQGLANTVWAFASAGHPSPALFDAIAAEATAERLAAFKTQGLANTAWGYASLAHPAPELLERIAAAAAPILTTFNAQEIANTAWAYVAADQSSALLFGGPHFVDHCLALEGAFTVQGLCQLHQWQLWIELEGRGGGAWRPLPPELAARCRATFVARDVSPSLLQRAVVQQLEALGLSAREEVVTPQGYSLDAVVQVQGRDVAVEVDGPRHFLGRAPTGKTLLKRRQLRAAEWALLAVPCTPIGCRARTPDPRMCALAGPCDSRLVCFAARRWRADWDWNWTLEQPQRQREYLASALERLLAEAKPLSDAAAPPTAEGLDAAGEQPRDGR